MLATTVSDRRKPSIDQAFSPRGWSVLEPSVATGGNLWQKQQGRIRQTRNTHFGRGSTSHVTGKPVSTERLRDLVRLRRVRDRIDRGYGQPLDVEALAREAHVPAGHFSRAFRAAYGE